MIDKNKINNIFSDLTILNNSTRLRILKYLDDNRGEHSFKDLSERVSNIEKTLLYAHLRLLYVSQMINNDGIRENAKYSITHKGIELLDKLKSDKTDELIISEMIC